MKKSDGEKKKKNPMKIVVSIILGFYLAAILMLLFSELNLFHLDENFRATNQVLILLALLILPFLVFGMSRFIQSIKLKISGQELELVLTDLKSDVNYKIVNMESAIKSKVSLAEQSLWPILAGYDIDHHKRLKENKIIIGAKEDVSQQFFANLLCEAIKEFVPQDVECELRIPNGGSLKNFADVKNGWIDIYMDFTGTCCQYFKIDHHNKSDKDIIKELNRYGKSIGLEWIDPLGASEDYCLVMRKSSAELNKVFSIRDLKTNGPNLIFSADPEFLNRDDCYVGMQKYGIVFKFEEPCSVTNRYELLDSGKADVFVGYETDPQLRRGDILRLEDPDQFFPRYMATPLVNLNTLTEISGLRDALNKLAGKFTTEDLIQTVNLLNNKSLYAQSLAKKYISDIKKNN